MYEFRRHTTREYVILYFRFLKMTVLSRMQYKLDTFFLTLAVLLRESVTVFTLYLMMLKFSQINGWNLGQLMFMYSLTFLTYSLCILIFTGIRDFESTVHLGEFDAFLTKPLNPFFQVLSRKSDVMAFLGHGTMGVILFVYSFHWSGIQPRWDFVLILLLTLIGGILIQASILLISAALSFWTVKSGVIQDLFFYQLRGFISYPITIYPTFIKILLTYVIPLAFVNYYPARAFLDSTPSVMAYLSPVVGLVMFTIALLVWKLGIRSYKSTGN